MNRFDFTWLRPLTAERATSMFWRRYSAFREQTSIRARLGVLGWSLCLGSLQPAIAQSQPAEKPPQAAGVAERNIDRVGEPWLRLNTSGHTGTVRAVAFLNDSQRLCSAGLDKVVQVWDLSAVRDAQFRDLKRDFLRERTIRWQVARGPRGSIYALAVAPSDGLLALGGYGAMGGGGEILVVDPRDGRLVRVLEGHRETVCSLDFSSDGNALLSVDINGETRVWRRPDWQPTILYHKDPQTYGAERAARIAALPRIRPSIMLGDNRVIVPVLIGAGDKETTWKLQEIDLANLKNPKTHSTIHRGQVLALAATPDGQTLASSDFANNVFVWDLKRGGAPVRLEAQALASSLAFNPEGSRLAIGTAVDLASQKSQLQVWDVAAKKLLRKRELIDHVHSCAISPDGARLAYVGGPRNEVYVEKLELPAPVPAATALRGWQRKIFKVAFAKNEPFYRVAFGATYAGRGFNDYGDLTEAFDPASGKITQGTDLDLNDWSAAEASLNDWHVRLSNQGLRIQLLAGREPRGVIDLHPDRQGHARAYCWIPGPDGRPAAIAIGADGQNSVYVYRIADRGACPLLRQFRGHQDYVTSIAVSRDQRYLVSGAADGMLQFWSLENYQQGMSTLGRWGAQFVTRDGGVIVDQISDAGPLYRRGVRAGDKIVKIGWRSEDGQGHESTNPNEIAGQLAKLPSATQVVFEYERGNRQPKSFQLVGAWQPVATLFASEGREWAFWTPEGYYDASANGHTLFGWQVNQGLFRLPDFFRADQFRRTLERPEVMRQLLAAGTLDESFRRLAANEPEADEALVTQIAAAPTVEILSPAAGEVLPARATKVRARVRLAADGEITQTRVFANGVGATQRNLIEERNDPETSQREVTYEWDVVMPRGERQMIQVFVGTKAQTTAFERVVVARRDVQNAPQPTRPKLHLLAVGVSQYADPEIPSLNYALTDAESIVAALEQGSNQLYDVAEPIILTDDQVTRANWTEVFAEFSERLRREAQPDDLLVIFFAGHGEVEDRTRTYHFICHDAKLASLLDGTATISWNDFGLLADVPCRKLALLDTCHSGAIQGVRQDPKLAIREFQENVIFTVAAAAGDESSLEAAAWGHGAFTQSLLDGLAGRADATTDGIVTLDELVTYVRKAVPEMTGSLPDAEGYVQHPSAAPQELLEMVTLEVSKTTPQAVRRISEFAPH